MIINRKEQTCTLTEEDKETLRNLDDDVSRAVISDMIEDIREDMERWVHDFNLSKKELIDSEAFFDMAYEMFETHYYTWFKMVVMDIVDRTKII